MTEDYDEIIEKAQEVVRLIQDEHYQVTNPKLQEAVKELDDVLPAKDFRPTTSELWTLPSRALGGPGYYKGLVLTSNVATEVLRAMKQQIRATLTQTTPFTKAHLDAGTQIISIFDEWIEAYRKEAREAQEE